MAAAAAVEEGSEVPEQGWVELWDGAATQLLVNGGTGEMKVLDDRFSLGFVDDQGLLTRATAPHGTV